MTLTGAAMQSGFSTGFLEAMLLGFAVAAPIGPVGVLCISRCIAGGAVLGLATGLGAATIHVGWMLIATVGSVNATTLDAWPFLAPAASLVTAALLGWMGLKALRRRELKAVAPTTTPATFVCAAAYSSGAVVAASNPLTGLFYLSAAPAIAASTGDLFMHNAMIAAGTFVGSMAWWISLSLAVAAMKERFSPDAVARVNKATGLLLLVIAGGVLLHGLGVTAAADRPNPSAAANLTGQMTLERPTFAASQK